jgi:hypothetical protein
MSTENQVPPVVEQEVKKDVVAYETHQKLLGEKKRTAEENAELKKRLEALETEKKQSVEAELKAKEDWKKLYEAEKAEKEKVALTNTEINARLQNGSKMRAFLDKVNGQVSEGYWGLVDLDSIIVNPDTGLPDDASVQKAAAEFEKKFPEVLKKPGSNGKIPNNAAQGGGTSLTYDQWKSLPLKEQKARLSEVINLQQVK